MGRRSPDRRAASGSCCPPPRGMALQLRINMDPGPAAHGRRRGSPAGAEHAHRVRPAQRPGHPRRHVRLQRLRTEPALRRAARQADRASPVEAASRTWSIAAYRALSNAASRACRPTSASCRTCCGIRCFVRAAVTTASSTSTSPNSRCTDGQAPTARARAAEHRHGAAGADARRRAVRARTGRGRSRAPGRTAYVAPLRVGGRDQRDPVGEARAHRSAGGRARRDEDGACRRPRRCAGVVARSCPNARRCSSPVRTIVRVEPATLRTTAADAWTR
jgi:hypothetical protein